MPALPTKRLFVYVATGLVVLVVGTLGLVLMRSGAASSAGELVIDAGGAGYDAVGIADLSVGATSSSTTTTQAPLIFVQVAGAVSRPDVYRLAADARVFQAVLEAGGFTEDADQQAVALAARLTDGCRVYVPRIGEAVAGTVQTPAESSAGVSGGSSQGGTSSGLVLLNSATLEQLDTLPGIGPALAQQIVTYRETKGPFTSIDQLAEVPGIGPAKLEQLRPLVGL
jgi:competence protein ComEA